MSVYLRGTCDKKHKHSSECKCWYYDFRLRGRRHRGAIPEARTKQQAEQAEAVIRSEMFSDRFGGIKQTPTLKEFIDKIYLPWARANKKSFDNDEEVCEVVKSHFKSKRLSEISPLDVERFKRVRVATKTKHNKERQPSTVNRELNIFSRVLTLAIDAGHIKENPCRRVKRFKEDNERIRFLSREEEKRLLSELEDTEPAHSIVVFALNTGMRFGEIASLCWHEVDFSRKLIHVTQTKTSKNRVIPMNQVVLDVLKEQKVRKTTKPEADLVFPSWKSGGRFTKLNSFKSACEEQGIEDFHFHDLRHTFASRLAEEGVSPFTIAELLGHRNLETTKRYTHATDGRKREAVEALNKPFSGKVVTIWSQAKKRKIG